MSSASSNDDEAHTSLIPSVKRSQGQDVTAAAAAVAEERTDGFDQLWRLPNALQAQVANFLQAGELIQETRRYARAHYKLAWCADLHYLCVTSLAQVYEMMNHAKYLLPARIRHLSLCLDAEKMAAFHTTTTQSEAQRALLCQFLQHVSLSLRTLELNLGSTLPARCCLLVRLCLDVEGFSQLSSVMISFVERWNEKDAAIDFDRKKDTDASCMDPLWSQEIRNNYIAVEKLRYRKDNTWYAIGAQLRRLFLLAPNLSHLSVTTPAITYRSCVEDLRMTCHPSRWHKLVSLRLSIDNFMWKNQQLTEPVLRWPCLRFYQNANDILSAHNFAHMFPVLEGLVVIRVTRFTPQEFFKSIVALNMDAAPRLRMLWTQDARISDLKYVVDTIFPNLELCGVLTNRDCLRPMKDTPSSSDLSHVRHFYTNNLCMADLAMHNRVSVVVNVTAAAAAAAAAAKIKPLSPFKHQLRSDTLQADHISGRIVRENVIQSFFMMRDLPTWSSARGDIAIEEEEEDSSSDDSDCEDEE
jgi:hypothetical protein